MDERVSNRFGCDAVVDEGLAVFLSPWIAWKRALPKGLSGVYYDQRGTFVVAPRFEYGTFHCGCGLSFEETVVKRTVCQRVVYMHALFFGPVY